MKLTKLLEDDISFKSVQQSDSDMLKFGKQIQNKLSQFFTKYNFKFLNRPGKDDIAIKISPNLEDEDLNLIFRSAQLQTTKEKSYTNSILSNQIILPESAWNRIFRNLSDDTFIKELKTKLEKIIKIELIVMPNWIGKSKFYLVKPKWSRQILPNKLRFISLEIKGITPKNPNDAEMGYITKSSMILSKGEWNEILIQLKDNIVTEQLKRIITKQIKKYLK